MKEGDTPSFLALLPNGLTDLERPVLGGWGGRFGRAKPNDPNDRG
ncbi:nucleoside hydrolase-like domain-containing protein [Isosphaera pallida]